MPEFSTDPAPSSVGETPAETIRLLGSMIQDAVILINVDRQIEAANAVAANLLKADLDALTGTAIQQWLPAFDFATRSRQAMSTTRGNGVLQPLRSSADDALIQVSVQRQPLGSGSARGELLVIQQESELHRLRYLVKKHEMLMNQTTAPCIIQGADGRIEFANQALERTFGYTPAEVNGRLPRELLSGEQTDLVQVEAGFATVMMGGSVQRDEVLYHKDGSPISVNYEQHAVTDDLGNIRHIVTTATDISERIKAEQMKSEFVSMVGHELRTPLTAVAGTIDVLTDARFVKLTPEVFELVRSAKRSCDSLNILISDLLDINKIEAGLVTMERKAVSIARCVADVQTELQTRASERSITLHPPSGELDRAIWADPNRLRQILSNLTNNAIKYGYVGGNIWTTVSLVDDQIAIDVADDGPGIAPSLQPELFDKFTRAPNVAAEGIEGFGLGLAICKSLIDQMGGTLTLVPTTEYGACFRLTLPAARANRSDAVCRAKDNTVASLPNDSVTSETQ